MFPLNFPIFYNGMKKGPQHLVKAWFRWPSGLEQRSIMSVLKCALIIFLTPLCISPNVVSAKLEINVAMAQSR